MDILFLIGRVLFGGFFVAMGANHAMKTEFLKRYAESKGVPLAGPAVLLSGLLFFLGGLGVLLGAYVEWALWALVLTLLLVSVKMHDFWAAPPEQKMAERVNFLKNAALVGAALAMLQIPLPWAFSLGL